MSDDELRKLLQNSLSGRRAPPEVRERILLSLRPRTSLRIAAGLAAAAVVALALAVALRPAPRLNPVIARAIEQHNQFSREMLSHSASAASPREIAQTVSDACSREIEMPGLRDGGFTQLQAHQCQATGWAHVVYANSWLKVSCFVLDADQLDVAGGKSISEPGIDAYLFSQDRYSVVAVRESGIAKLWVADLGTEHLAAIAFDAEQKRYQLQTVTFNVTDKGIVKPMGAMLQSTPGVEGVQMEPSRQEAVVKYDRRRVTAEEIAALLMTNGFAASPREWEHR